MSVSSSTLTAQLSVIESITSGAIGTSTLLIDGANATSSLNTATTPAATLVIHELHTLSGTTLLLDLTDAPGTNIAAGDSDAQTAAGLRLQQFIIRNLSVTNTLKIEADATAGYDVFGASGIVLLPAATATVPSLIAGSVPENSTDVVAATNDEILFTGTSAEQFEYILVFG